MASISRFRLPYEQKLIMHQHAQPLTLAVTHEGFRKAIRIVPLRLKTYIEEHQYKIPIPDKQPFPKLTLR
jgi:hypothetical protein